MYIGIKQFPIIHSKGVVHSFVQPTPREMKFVNKVGFIQRLYTAFVIFVPKHHLNCEKF